MKNKQHPKKNRIKLDKLPPSHYDKTKGRLSGIREIIIFMVPRCLRISEVINIENFVSDPNWVIEHALTSSIAKDILGVRFFRARRPELERMLAKRNLPFHLFPYPNPNGMGLLYFLLFTGHSEPPSQDEIRLILMPRNADDFDNENRALILS